MRSIERYLLSWIIGALTLGSVLVALVMYLVILDEMNHVFDDDLMNVAKAVASYHHAGHVLGDAATPVPPVREDSSDIVTLTWTRTGERVYSSDQRVDVPFATVEGFSRSRIGNED